MDDEVKVEDVAPKKPKKPIDIGKGGLIWTIWSMTEAALLLVCGVLAIVFSNDGNFQKYVLIIIGSFLALGGVLKILMNFLPIIASNSLEAAMKIKTKAAMAYDMVIGGSLELALGITLIIVNVRQLDLTVLVTFVSYFVGIVLIVAGVGLLLFAIAFLITKLYRLYMPILEIIFALILIALGIWVLIYFIKESSLMQVVLIIVGVLLLLSGIGMVANTVQAIVNRSEKKRAAKEAAKHQDASESDVEMTVDVTTEQGRSETAASPSGTPQDDKETK